jgi:hypothetical protein
MQQQLQEEQKRTYQEDQHETIYAVLHIVQSLSHLPFERRHFMLMLSSQPFHKLFQKACGCAFNGGNVPGC